MLLFRVFDQRGNAFGNRCALANPMFNTIQIQTQTFSLTGSDRVEKANTFNKATVARIAAVGHDDLIERAFLAPPRAKRIVTITSSLVNKTTGPCRGTGPGCRIKSPKILPVSG
ncbi:hypothetical protein SODG_007386 [Sodalis praecaptivus]